MNCPQPFPKPLGERLENCPACSFARTRSASSQKRIPVLVASQHGRTRLCRSKSRCSVSFHNARMTAKAALKDPIPHPDKLPTRAPVCRVFWFFFNAAANRSTMTSPKTQCRPGGSWRSRSREVEPGVMSSTIPNQRHLITDCSEPNAVRRLVDTLSEFSCKCRN